MAGSSTASVTQDPNPPPSQPDNPNSHPKQPDSQPDSSQPSSSTSGQLPPPPIAINPNPNPNPSSVPPLVSPLPSHISPYGHPPPMGSSAAAVVPPAAPSFRPAGVPTSIPVPQFTPIPPNPNLHAYQTPPPGVSSAPPPLQPMYLGQQPNPALRPPYVAMPNGYMAPVPQGTVPPPGVIRYPYPPIARPAFLARPAGALGTVPTLPRPPFLAVRPPVTPPIVRPSVLPVVTPAEKLQTTVYVGKIASSVENEFIRALLELCGPIKSWKRAQDPSNGTPKRFGLCEFESAEGVLRALRLLSKCSIDGEELMLNVDQATRGYLKRYVEKKKENLNKPSETGAEETKKEGENAADFENGEGDKKNEPAKPSDESKKDENETGNTESDTSVFGLVTDEDRDADREAVEKLTNMIEERRKTKPPPPPPPPVPPQKVVDGVNNSNSEVPAKSGDKESDIDVKIEEKNDDETTSETKPASRAGTESPDRGRRYDSRGRDRDRERDKREKERELDRLERERERERARRERERELEIQRAEHFYKERVKEWESREKDKEYKRKQERDKEKDRERERRKLVAEQEDESDDDTRKRRRKSEIEDKRRRRRREKEEDLADRLKEEEEIAEAKKRAEEEEERRQQENLTSVEVANGVERPTPEDDSNEMKDNVEQVQDSDSAQANHTGDGIQENGNTDDTVMASGPTTNAKPSGIAPTKKLGFGIVGSGKRTTVPSVFHEEEDDDAQKEKKLRPLVPIDYSTEEQQATHTNDVAVPPSSAASAESVKPVSKEVKCDAERERSRRSHDRSGHRDRDRDRGDGDDARARDGNADNRKILDAKQLIDMIPKTKDDLFSYEINWPVYDENRLHERMRPWISKKITEFLGEEETTLVEFIVDKFREHVKAETMLDILQQVLDEEAEMFVLKMWRMLIFEIKRVETGLAPRPGA